MGFLFILMYLILIGLVLEISSTILIITGLDKEVARFQAISMLTSTGYTTMESELILRHPIRRKIGMFLILFGVFSLAVLISSLGNLIEQNFRIPPMLLIIAVLGILMVTIRKPRFMEALGKKLQRHLKQEFKLHKLPIEEVLYINEGDTVTDIPIVSGSSAINLTSAELFEPDEDMMLLFIQRGSEKIRSRVTTIQEGDLLFMYGMRSAIEGKFRAELENRNKEMQDEQLISGI